MPEPSNPEARRARDEIRGLLEATAMQQTESSASRRRRLPQSSLRSPPDKRERPRFIPSPPPSGTRWPLSMNASSTTANLEMPVTTSTSVVGTRVVTEQLEVTTSTGAGATIARRIEAHHPSHQALGSSARPSVKHNFRLSSALPPTTLTKYNGETKPELWLADFHLACQLDGATDD
jgi:hypothetical protein